MTLRIFPPTRRAFARERPAAVNDSGSYLTSNGTFQLVRSRNDARYAAVSLAIAFGYFAAAKLGFSLALTTEQVTAIWPPTGIAIAALLLLGYRVWPGIFAGALLANATSGEALLTAVGIAIGNTLTGVAGAFLLRNFYKFHITLERTRDVLGLVAVALASTLISATLGTANLAVAHIVAWPAFASVWVVWWVGDTLGILLIAPLLLSWWTRPRVQWREWRIVEYAALFVSIATVSYLTFARTIPPDQSYHVMAYSSFPFLIWAAFRFEQREVVSAVLIIAIVAVWGTAHDLGPFTHGTLDERLVVLDAFIAMTVITALLLGAVTAERRQSQERLRRARDEMERRVQERTADLERANNELYEMSYSMSHDLRAPLRAVNAFSDLLTEKYAGALDDEGVRFLTSIAKNSRQMGKMIDDYLRLFSLRNEKLDLKPVDFDVLVRELIGDLFAPSVLENVQFDLHSLPVVVCDRGLVRQVWANLLDNAVKFSRNCDRPLIEIGGHVDRDEVVYYVKDNGIGFDMKWTGQLFKVFQRLHPREFDGIGMGLAIVARIVQHHGGRVRAEGEVGHGATFFFALPRHS